MKTHYTIPFFIHHEGCPHKCVFCDQRNITGRASASPGDIPRVIEEYLSTMPARAAVETAFFGGSFTGISRERQRGYLDMVRPYIDSGRVRGVRLSTRPDLMGPAQAKFLKARGVTCVELGVQSMSDKVLRSSGRGHTADDTKRASEAVRKEGLELGHQIMLGLPGSSFEDEMETARRVVKLGALQARIYPTVVIEGTELACMWRRGEYSPLGENDSLARAAELLSYFSSNGVRVLRCGLHPSEELSTRGKLLAGPFHPAFRLKAESLIFARMLGELIGEGPENISRVLYNPDDEGALRGYGGMNSEAIKKLTSGKLRGFISAESRVRRGFLAVERNGRC